MRRYIFLTNSISNIGGGQLYIASKVAWLQNEGWDVNVWYSQRDGRILIEFLRNFIDNYEPTLGLPPSCVSKDVMKRVSHKIMPESFCGDSEDVIIESHFVRHSLWGEILSEKCSGRHIVYIITEKVSEVSPSLLEFYEHKLRRNALFGIERESVPTLLPEADSETTWLRASGCITSPTVVDEDNGEYTRFERNDLNILTISRLEKVYIPTIFREVVKFCRSVPERRVGFIIVGDTPDAKKRERLLKLLTDVENLEVIFKGYMFPISDNVLKVSDIFIGGSGSVRIASAAGIRAIVVSPEDCQVMGYFGETTESTVYRTASDIRMSVSEAIKDSFAEIKKLRAVHKSSSFTTLDSFKTDNYDFSRHAEIIEILRNCKEPDYYNVRRVILSSGKEFMIKWLCRMLGIKGYFKMKHGVRKLLSLPYE